MESDGGHDPSLAMTSGSPAHVGKVEAVDHVEEFFGPGRTRADVRRQGWLSLLFLSGPGLFFFSMLWWGEPTVVLGGISTAGGKGNFPGTVISIFTIGLLKYGLGLINVNSQTILMIIGAILIIVVTIPNIRVQKNAMKAVKPSAKSC